MSRLIDVDALINEIKKETEKAIKQDDGVGAFWFGYFAGLVLEQPTIQPVETDTNVGNKISKFIDGLEEIFADIRERHVDDSVCGLCEYDGAYIGESGDWCNECSGFEKDDCFKLSDDTRKKWTDEIIKALQTIQPENQHGKIFQEIVVEYPSYYIYPEYKGKPYFSIKYTENGKEFIDYGTYKPEVLSKRLKEYFMPSAQPEYELVTAEDFAKTMSENTIYSFRAWHSMALLELMEKQGFVICKKTM